MLEGSRTASIRVLSEEDVRKALPVEAAIVAQREAFRQLAADAARIPPRTVLRVEGGTTLFMPGALGEPSTAGVKVVSVMPGNPRLGIAPVLGAVLLLDARTGVPLALMDATYLTALRTAAGSALAVDLLAASDAAVLAVFGAGAQAREHIRAVRAVRGIREVRIVSRRPERARALAASLGGVETRADLSPRGAVEGADIIVTATNSPTPVFRGLDVGAGAHVCAIGAYTPATREVDDDVVRRARIVVDTREGALTEAGDLLLPMAAGVIGEGDIAAELGELVAGSRPGGRQGREITLYKSVGNAVQDLMTAQRALEAASALGLGQVVPL